MRKLLVGMLGLVLLVLVLVAAVDLHSLAVPEVGGRAGRHDGHRAAGDDRRALPAACLAADRDHRERHQGRQRRLGHRTGARAAGLARRQARPARLLARGPRPGRPAGGDQAGSQSRGRQGRSQELGFRRRSGRRCRRCEAGGPAPIPPFVLGDVRISEGAVAYDDRAAGTSKRAEAIALTIKQAGPDQPVSIDGGLTFEGKRATLTGSVDRPQGAAAGERSPIKLSLGVPGATAAFDGEIETKAPAANGSLDVKLTAPRELLAWVGAATPGGLPGSATLQGRVDLSASRAALSAMELHADQISASGDAAVDLTQPPKVTGDIALARLDLSPYLAPEGSPGAPAAKADGTAGTGWPDTPIELPLPLPVDADLRVHGDGVKAGKIEIGAFATRLQADRQQAAVTIDQLQAFGGGLKGTLKARQAPPRPTTWTSTPTASACSPRPTRLPGSTASTAGERCARRSRPAAAMCASWSARSAATAASPQGRGGARHQHRRHAAPDHDAGPRQCGRRAAADRFRRGRGELQDPERHPANEDLHLRAPVLRLEGAGAVDLPQRTIDYADHAPARHHARRARAPPASRSCRPASRSCFRDPYASPSVRFDLNGTLTSAISGPEDVARLAADLAKSPEAVKVLKDQFDLLEKLPAPAAGAAASWSRACSAKAVDKARRAQPAGVPDVGNSRARLSSRADRPVGGTRPNRVDEACSRSMRIARRRRDVRTARTWPSSTSPVHAGRSTGRSWRSSWPIWTRINESGRRQPGLRLAAAGRRWQRHRARSAVRAGHHRQHDRVAGRRVAAGVRVPQRACLVPAPSRGMVREARRTTDRALVGARGSPADLGRGEGPARAARPGGAVTGSVHLRPSLRPGRRAAAPRLDRMPPERDGEPWTTSSIRRTSRSRRPGSAVGPRQQRGGNGRSSG